MGDGFVAVDGGTFNVTGTNTIANTGPGFFGNGLVLANVTVGASGANFNSVTASGTGANAAGDDVILIAEVTGGTVSVGTVNVAETFAGDGIQIDGGSADVTFGSVTINNTADEGIEIENNYAGTATFTGPVMITNPGTAGIDLEDVDGSVIFSGTTTVQLGADADARGINFDGTTNAATFGVITISGVGTGADQVGIDFNAATLNAAVNFQSVSISGPTSSANSIGIDLTGVLGDQTVNIGEQVIAGLSSSITGLHRGVVIDNTAAVQFTFGDGEGLTDTGSSIDVNGQPGAFIIDAGGGTLPASSFNFNDVTFGAGDSFNFPVSPTAPVFVSEAGGTVSAGVNNLSADLVTVTVAQAEAQANSGQTFVFVGDNTGGIDLTGGGTDGFTLEDGQSIDGFADGNAISFGLIVPTNVMGDFGALGGSVTSDDVTASNSNAGATSIVSSTGAGSHMILNFDIDATGLGLGDAALSISGATTTSTVHNVDFSNVGGGADGINIVGSSVNLSNFTLGGTNDIQGQGIDITDGGSDIDVTLNNVTISEASNTGISVNGSGAGSVTISGTGNSINYTTGHALSMTDTTIGAGGLTFTNVVALGTTISDGIDISDASGGTITFDSVNLAGFATTTGLDISGNSRSANVVVTGGTIANGVRINNSGTGTVQIGADISDNAGFALQVANRAAGAGDVTITGTVTNDSGAVSIMANSGGNVNLTNTVTGTGSNTAGAIDIDNNSGGTVTFSGLVDIDVTGNGTGVQIGNAMANSGGNVNLGRHQHGDGHRLEHRWRD